ncbi:MAG: hypothetical protein FWG79_01655 [Bacteroidales bacterium]|nr:hypothetical protein [Bacteroidales bacterium]
MKTTLITMFALICFVNANISANVNGQVNTNDQNKTRISDYFPDMKQDTIITSVYLWNMVDFEREIDTNLALKYFFNNNSEEMHDIFEGYNVDENTSIYVPFVKKVHPIYRKRIDDDLYLLYYYIQSVIYLTMYDYANDKFESTLMIGDFSDDMDVFTRSTIFSNNYIVTVQSAEEAYYILSKIDYATRRIIELKKMEVDVNQPLRKLVDDSFEALGISKEGELLEPIR